MPHDRQNNGRTNGADQGDHGVAEAAVWAHIRGRFDPAQLTAATGIQPRYIRRFGETTRAGRKSPDDGWSVRVELTSLDFGPPLVMSRDVV